MAVAGAVAACTDNWRPCTAAVVSATDATESRLLLLLPQCHLTINELKFVKLQRLRAAAEAVGVADAIEAAQRMRQRLQEQQQRQR